MPSPSPPPIAPPPKRKVVQTDYSDMLPYDGFAWGIDISPASYQPAQEGAVAIVKKIVLDLVHDLKVYYRDAETLRSDLLEQEKRWNEASIVMNLEMDDYFKMDFTPDEADLFTERMRQEEEQLKRYYKGPDHVPVTSRLRWMARPHLNCLGNLLGQPFRTLQLPPYARRQDG